LWLINVPSFDEQLAYSRKDTTCFDDVLLMATIESFFQKHRNTPNHSTVQINKSKQVESPRMQALAAL
jgi:hypothetical protein